MCVPSGYVLGVDGGGTTTRAVIISTDGELVYSGRAGPSNPITIGVDRALASILGVGEHGLGGGKCKQIPS